jgi:hypothetical protein
VFFLLPTSQLAGTRVTDWNPYKAASPILISNLYWNTIYLHSQIIDLWMVLIASPSPFCKPDLILKHPVYFHISRQSGFELRSDWHNCLHFCMSIVLFQYHVEAAAHAKWVAHTHAQLPWFAPPFLLSHAVLYTLSVMLSVHSVLLSPFLSSCLW